MTQRLIGSLCPVVEVKGREIYLDGSYHEVGNVGKVTIDRVKEQSIIYKMDRSQRTIDLRR